MRGHFAPVPPQAAMANATTGTSGYCELAIISSSFDNKITLYGVPSVSEGSHTGANFFYQMGKI